TAVGTALVQLDGSWSTSSPVTLNTGSNALTAQFSDAAGNTGTSTAVIYTLNTTAPSGGTPVLAAAADSGTSHSDDITNVTAPSFTVALGATVVAGDTVQLLLGGSALAHPVSHTITAAEVTAGSVSLAVVAGDLGADGSKAISAQFSDGFGSSSTTAALIVTLDTVAPSGGTPVLTAASDSGISHSDDITNVTAPSFTVALGAADEAGDTVQLLLGGSALAHPVSHTITAAEVSAGSVNLTVVAGDLGADGSKAISAQFSDLAGNSSTTAALSITLDTTAPTVTIKNLGGPTHQAQQTISGTVDLADASAGATVTIFDGATAVGTALVQLDGSWSTSSPVTLNTGSNALTAQFSDAAGNTGTSNAVIYTLNTTAPAEAIAITAIVGNSSPNNLIVSGTNGALSVDEKIQIRRDGGTTWTNVVQDTRTSWSLADGTTHSTNFTYQARIVDSVGNIGTTVSQAVLVPGSGTLFSPGFAVDFTGTGGDLVLGSSPSITSTVDAISTADGAVAITGSGNVTTSFVDAIVLTASGGTQR